jgi:hypothetical protein
VLPVNRALKVRQVCKDHLVLQAFRERTEEKVHRVHLVNLDQRVLMESLVELGSLVSRVTMAQQGHQGLEERKDHLAMWAALELQVHLANLDQMVPRANLVHLVPMDYLVQMAKQDPQDHLV